MRGLIELAVVVTFVIGWAVLELVALSLDKRRAARKPDDQPTQESATGNRADDPPP